MKQTHRGRLTTCVIALVLVIAACADDSEAFPRVIAPNEIIAELVERVACAEDVDVVVAGLDVEEINAAPILTITLDPPADPSADPLDATLIISVPAATTTIEAPGGPDPWIWLDPVRLAELSQSIGAGLAASGSFDPSLLDRCLDRIAAETELLDSDLFERTSAVPVEQRLIDVSLPGVLYFANRYEFGIAETDEAVDAGRIMSVDSLGSAATYDELMRNNVDEVVELLGG